MKTGMFICIGILAVSLLSTSAFAQGALTVSSVPRTTAINTGHTEIAGDILVQMPVAAGGFGAGSSTLTVDYGAPITVPASGFITVCGTGALAGIGAACSGAGSAYLANTTGTPGTFQIGGANQNQLLIVLPTTPAAGGAGSSLSINGVKVGLAAFAGTKLTAILSTSAPLSGGPYTIASGQNVTDVISSIAPAFTTAMTTGSTALPLGGTGRGQIFTTGTVGDRAFTIDVFETFVDAFKTTLGQNGYLNDPALSLVFNNVPNGVFLNLAGGLDPANLASGSAGNTACSLATTDPSLFYNTTTGASVAIPVANLTNPIISNSNNSTVLNFTGLGFNLTQLEAIRLRGCVYTSGVMPPLTPGTITATITMSPNGAALSAGTQIPPVAGNFPRYAQELIPAVTSSEAVTKVITFPAATADTKVVVSNVSSGAAVLTARARQGDGTVIAGAPNATFNVQSKQSVSLVPRLVFPGVDLSSLATIEVESQSQRVIGNSLDRSATASYVRPFINEATDTYLPFDRKTSADVPLVIVNNTKTDAAALTLTLKNSIGQVVATSSRSVPPSGLLREPLTALFGVQSGAFGLSGYVVVSSASGVRASLLNNPGGTPEAVFGGTTAGQQTIPIPFYAFGGPYATTVSLINASSAAKAHFTLTPFQVSGGPLSGATPYSGDINPGERLDLDLARIFGGNQSSPAVGYLSLAVDPIMAGNPLSAPPPVSGLVRIATGPASTTLPISFNPGTELFLNPTTESRDEYVGVSILNAGTSPTDVTVELTTPDGVSRGTSTFTLAGGGMRSALLRELIPGLVEHQDGTLRISSAQPVFSVGFRGSLTLSDLTYLHVQTAPQ